MGRLYQSVGAYALHCLVIDFLCLGLHVIVGDHQRAYLLVAILCKLVLERLERVIFRIDGCADLQLVVNEEVDIFLDGLLVDAPLGIVLIVGIFKF